LKHKFQKFSHSHSLRRLDPRRARDQTLPRKFSARTAPVSVLVHRCLNGRAPPYLQDYCVPVASAVTRRHLRSANRQLYLQYLATVSTLTAAKPFHSPAPQSWTLSRISSGTRPSMQSVSDVCLKHICSLHTSAFSALEVIDDYCAITRCHGSARMF